MVEGLPNMSKPRAQFPALTKWTVVSAAIFLLQRQRQRQEVFLGYTANLGHMTPCLEERSSEWRI